LRHIPFASLRGRDNPFEHDFVDHGRLPCVIQFFARGIERPANAAHCRSVKDTYRNEPKNRQHSHAIPLRVHPTLAIVAMK
jgi:hypothetical protein